MTVDGMDELELKNLKLSKNTLKHEEGEW